MDAPIVARIRHAVRAPRVEDPGLARSHVLSSRPTVEGYVGMRHYGHVHAHAIEPVVRYVAMALRFGVSVEPHQARSTDHRVEAREHLRQIGARREVRRRPHRSNERVALGIATD